MEWLFSVRHENIKMVKYLSQRLAMNVEKRSQNTFLDNKITIQSTYVDDFIIPYALAEVKIFNFKANE